MFNINVRYIVRCVFEKVDEIIAANSASWTLCSLWAEWNGECLLLCLSYDFVQPWQRLVVGMALALQLGGVFLRHLTCKPCVSTICRTKLLLPPTPLLACFNIEIGASCFTGSVRRLKTVSAGHLCLCRYPVMKSATFARYEISLRVQS